MFLHATFSAEKFEKEARALDKDSLKARIKETQYHVQFFTEIFNNGFIAKKLHACELVEAIDEETQIIYEDVTIVEPNIFLVRNGDRFVGSEGVFINIDSKIKKFQKMLEIFTAQWE